MRKRKTISTFAGILDYQLVSFICLFLNMEEPCQSIVTAKSVSVEVFQMKYEKWSVFHNNMIQIRVKGPTYTVLFYLMQR